MALPLGSRIIIESFTSDITKSKVKFISNSGFLESLSSLDHLYRIRKLPLHSIPPTLSVNELRHVRYINGNVSIVEIPERHGAQQWVFKTNLRESGAIYHELKLLTSMNPHPNIINRPQYIITVDDENGSSAKVLGFILEYFGSGTLGAVLETKPTVELRTKLRWATQIARTMDEIRNGPAGFYSDLKPDNVLVSHDGLDLVFIDFEQAGNWDTFLAPEILYARWMEILSQNALVPEAQRTKYSRLLVTTDGASKKSATAAPGQSFRRRWEFLSPQQREQGMVFAVGKLLWCIFEGVSHTSNSTEERYELPTPIEFPQFSRTPERLRELIRQCTCGASEWTQPEAKPGIKLRLFNFVAETFEPDNTASQCSPKEAMNAAKRLWTRRVQEMHDYMEARRRWLTNVMNEGDELYLGFCLRPSIAQILSVLEREECSLANGNDYRTSPRTKPPSAQPFPTQRPGY